MTKRTQQGTQEQPEGGTQRPHRAQWEPNKGHRFRSAQIKSVWEYGIIKRRNLNKKIQNIKKRDTEAEGAGCSHAGAAVCRGASAQVETDNFDAKVVNAVSERHCGEAHRSTPDNP